MELEPVLYIDMVQILWFKTCF